MPKKKGYVCETMLGRKIERHSPAQLSQLAIANERLNFENMAKYEDDSKGGGSGQSAEVLNAEAKPKRVESSAIQGPEKTRGGYGKSRGSSSAPSGPSGAVANEQGGYDIDLLRHAL